MVVEAKLHQHKLALGTSQNMAMAVALLDTLPAPSIDVVGNVYQQLKSILSTATA
jgi:hypothetical protein